MSNNIDALGVVRRRRNTADTPPHLAQAQVVLTAITQVIAEKQPQQMAAGKGIPTPTAYFAALMSSLDQLGKHTADTLGAILYLLAMLLSKVPEAVLQAKLDPVATLLVKVVHERGAMSEAVLRYSVASCAHLLRISEQRHWTAASMSTTQLLQVLLVYSSDPRAKIRKLAQKGVAETCTKLQSAGGIPAPLSAVLASYCVREITQCTTKKCQVALYLCGLLGQVIPLVGTKEAAAVLEALLNLAAGGRNSILTVQALGVCKALFKADNVSEKHARLVDQLLQAMPGLSTHIEDAQGSVSYLKAIAEGQTRLCIISPTKAAKRLPVLCEVTSRYLLSTKPEVVSTCGKQLVILFGKGVSPQAVQSLKGKPSAVSQVIKILEEQLRSFRHRETWSLTLRAIAALLVALPVLETGKHLLQAADSLNAHQLGVDEGGGTKLVSALEHLTSAILTRFGPAAVLSILPLEQPVEEGADEEAVAGRWWMLPLMKKRVQATELQYFGDSFLPLVASLKQQQQEATAAGLAVRAKVLEHNCAMVWDTFPAFCTRPTDLSATFKKLAKRLVPFLSSGLPNEQLAICRGIRCLVKPKASKKSEEEDEAKVEIPDEDRDPEELADEIAQILAGTLTLDKHKGSGKDEDDVDPEYLEQLRVAIGPVSGKLLPVLFNLVHTTPANKRVVVLEAISGLSSIAPEKDVNALFQMALTKFLAEADKKGGGDREGAGEALADIVYSIANAQHALTKENQALLFRTAGSQLSSLSPGLQKKGYRLLSVLCDRHQGFFETHWQETVDRLSSTQADCHPVATKARLGCLRAVMMRVPHLLHQPDILQVLPSLVGEVILACKEGSKTRELATTLLLRLGHAMKDATPTPQTKLLSSASLQSPYPLLSEFMCIVLGGLGGQTQRMRSASVLVLSRLVYEFRSDFQPAIVTDLLTTVLLLLREKSREIVKAVLGFSKVAVLVLDKEILRPHLPQLLEGLTLWCEDTKNRFRQKVKGIFELLVRKYGSEVIMGLVPHTHTKLIEHIHKQEERTKRKKAEGREHYEQQHKGENQNLLDSIFNGGMDLEDDEDDEDDSGAKRGGLAGKGKKRKSVEPSGKRQKKGREPQDKKGQHFLKEDASMDLLSSGMARNVLGAKPTAEKEKSVRTKMAVGNMAIVEGEDGRIMIQSKRKALRNEGTLDEDPDAAPRRGGLSGLKKSTKKGQNRRDMTGKSYKASKAGGDMQKGRLEPFAYMGLDPSQLNRRSGSKKGAGRFAGLIKSAKSGSKQGRKLNRKQKGTKKKGTRK